MLTSDWWNSLPGVSDEDIKTIRNATIITEITIDEDEFSISTSDSASPEQANTVTFTPGTAVNITNPITGEQLEFLATILGPSTIQTRSEGLDSGTVELKTWTFSPGGASVTTELHKDNKLFPITANQVIFFYYKKNIFRSVLYWLVFTFTSVGDGQGGGGRQGAAFGAGLDIVDTEDIVDIVDIVCVYPFLMEEGLTLFEERRASKE